MDDITFLTVTGQGVGRAYHDGSDWTVENHLSDQDVRCLAGAPWDHQIVFAGTQGNGVFRSLDGGRTWLPMGMEGRIVKSLAASPHHAGQVYAGTKPPSIWRFDPVADSWAELPGFRQVPGRWFWWSPQVECRPGELSNLCMGRARIAAAPAFDIATPCRSLFRRLMY